MDRADCPWFSTNLPHQLCAEETEATTMMPRNQGSRAYMQQSPPNTLPQTFQRIESSPHHHNRKQQHQQRNMEIGQ